METRVWGRGGGMKSNTCTGCSGWETVRAVSMGTEPGTSPSHLPSHVLHTWKSSFLLGGMSIAQVSQGEGTEGRLSGKRGQLSGSPSERCQDFRPNPWEGLPPDPAQHHRCPHGAVRVSGGVAGVRQALPLPSPFLF